MDMTPLFELPSHGNVDVSKALESSLQCGDLLYHFTSLETGIEKILPSRKLRLAPLTGTNDPLEFQEIVPIAVGSVNPDDLMAELQLGDGIKRLRQQSLLTCFCAEHQVALEPGEKGWKRVRMWAQYGGKHRGMCLVFHKARLQATVCRRL